MKKLGLLFGLALLTGCGDPISQEAKQMKAKPIVCADARQDIAALQGEKASIGRRIAAGARFIVPVSAIVHIFQEGAGNPVVKERRAVATGEYNSAIDAKIGEIRAACNV